MRSVFICTAVWALLPSISAAAPCPHSLTKGFAAQGLTPEICVCDDSLKNVEATLPPALTLLAACDLRESSSAEPIELRRTKVTFDQYTNGNLPMGQLLIKGKLRLRGVLRIEEGPAGIYSFTPARPIIAKDTPLRVLLGGIEFDDEDRFERELHVPDGLPAHGCVEADLVIEVTDIQLVLGDGDEAGAIAVHDRVLEQKNYRHCAE